MEEVEGKQVKQNDAHATSKPAEPVLDNKHADNQGKSEENIISEEKIRTDSPEIKKDSGNEKENKLDPEEKDIEEVKANENVPDKFKAAGSQGRNVWQNENEGEPSPHTPTEEKIAEEEPEGISLEDAILEQRQKEKEAFQRLIDENVRLKKDVKEMEIKMNQAEAKENTIKEELQKEREKINELQKRTKELETEIDTEKNSPENVEGPSEKDKYEKKIKDLQTRLKRMAKDEEEKDQRNQELESQLKNKDEHIQKLEQHVDKVKVEEIRTSQQKNETESENKTNENTVVSNVVGEPDVRRSKMCIIM